MGPKKATLTKEDIDEILESYVEKQDVKIRSTIEEVVGKHIGRLEKDINAMSDGISENAHGLKSAKSEINKLESELLTCKDTLNVTKIQLNAAITKLEQKQIDMDVYSRRSSIHFKGIQEVIEGENCEEIIKTFILEKMGIDTTDIKFERVHRIPIGPKANFKFHRTITAKFLWFKDKDRVWRARTKLKDHPGFFIEESFPATVERNRKVLFPVYKAARAENMRATLIADTLLVDGRKYRVEDLQRLPENIGFAASQRKVADIVTLFNSATSPLGRNFPCRFSENGRIFHSVAQYVAYTQADMFEDHDAASRVMASQNSSACEKIGKNVKGFSEALWNMRVEAVLEKANTLKFTQNPELSSCLRTTSGTERIGECNPYESFYGTGCKIADLNAGKPDQWPGKNINGKILKLVRDKLAS